MTHEAIINQLEVNRQVIHGQLSKIPVAQQKWKKDKDTWSLLEIICHLYDEEREDFRYRINHIMDTPDVTLPTFNPLDWVTDRDYINQDFEAKLNSFNQERLSSITWLTDNLGGHWDNIYHHPSMGELTSSFFLSNWLAHDFIHIRQINRTNYHYFTSLTYHSLDYAGNW